MVSNGYTNVSLPDSLIESIDELVGTLGYVSISEFVKDSCRRRLESLNGNRPTSCHRLIAVTGDGHRIYSDPEMEEFNNARKSNVD